MREERQTLDAPGGPMPASLAEADGFPPGPAVVVVQEWWGLDAHIQDGIDSLFTEAAAAEEGAHAIPKPKPHSLET